MTITIRNTEVRSINMDTVCIAGQDVAVTWSSLGACVGFDQIAAIREAVGANWSTEEMKDIAYRAETVMGEAFESDYRIAFVNSDGSGFDVVESFRAIDDDTANAYADENYGDQEWYVLNAAGRNINGGRDQ